MSRLIYGVGYNSKREHKSSIDSKVTPAYRAWRSMLERCYSAKLHERCPTYIGCSVANEWHDFQDFADWFVGHRYYGLGYDLDKDILSPGNKVYSPETCCLVPHEINSLFSDSVTARGDYPRGVSFHKATGRFQAQLGANRECRFLGFFDCPNEAYQAYKTAKENHVKAKAMKFRGRISAKVFSALMEWSLPE